MIKTFINYSIGFGIVTMIWCGIACLIAKTYLAIKKEMDK